MNRKAAKIVLFSTLFGALVIGGALSYGFFNQGLDRETRLALIAQLKQQVDDTITVVASARDEQQLPRLANQAMVLGSGLNVDLVNGYPSRESIVSLLREIKAPSNAATSAQKWGTDYDVNLERKMVQFVVDKKADSTYCYIKYFEARPYVAPIVVVDTKGC
ncbi:hypothetical protein VST7929_03000 [Vibrio stylophorae]|uniref:Uncharacterized protein n=1 Tax=Vibrio stylophorae TaxID=659351 RepID=A0ABN8DXH9_9VIBR|nr:hypothetical protein [Vibrio stylophorae]CAH0535427.1 hypothetical protein VST7929_03000 [Vibrio stylophorae]